MKNLYTSINLTEEEKKVAEELFSEDDPFIVLAKIYENNLKASKSKIYDRFNEKNNSKGRKHEMLCKSARCAY